MSMSVIFNNLGGAGRRLPFLGWKRMPVPREAAGYATPVAAIPALVNTGGRVRAYSGRSRFVFSPLSLSLDQILLLITAGLLCFGLVMVQSADARVRGLHENWWWFAFQ